MVSLRLRRIFALSIPVFIVHGLEEYVTGFYNTDPFSRFVFGSFNALPTWQATFLVFQFMWWAALLLALLFLAGEKWQLRIMVVFGLIFVFEFHHLVQTIVSGRYYPGAVTALAFPVLAYVFRKELIANFRNA